METLEYKIISLCEKKTPTITSFNEIDLVPTFIIFTFSELLISEKLISFLKKLNYLHSKKNLKGDHVILLRFLIKKKALLYTHIPGNGLL